jgi:glycosyltransferase involved in cell wall biosynthesis
MVSEVRPTHIVAVRLQTWEYVSEIRNYWSGTTILDLDEASAPLVQSLGLASGDGSAHRARQRVETALVRYEKEAVESADEVWVSSAIEAQNVRDLHGPEIRCRIISNVVDVDHYQQTPKDARPVNVLFPGNFQYPPNQWAAREILEEILPLLPESRISFAGSHMPEWLSAARNSRVDVVKGVTDMREQFARASAVVVPIRAGGGTRLKVLEALASRVPVVATAKAVEGIDLVPGKHYLQGDTPEDLAAMIRVAVEGGAHIDEMVDEGLRFVVEHCSIPALAQAMQSSWDCGL